jgi:hypothetical protein
LPACRYFPCWRRAQRVFFRSFLCFFLRMRLRRFLIRDPMADGHAISRVAERAQRLRSVVQGDGHASGMDVTLVRRNLHTVQRLARCPGPDFDRVGPFAFGHTDRRTAGLT